MNDPKWWGWLETLGVVSLVIGVIALVAAAVMPQPTLQRPSEVARGVDSTFGNVCYSNQQGAIACVHVPGLSAQFRQ